MPTELKRIIFICLACSKKFNAFCVAGKLINKNRDVGEWVRPMNSNQVIELSDREYSKNQGYAAPLDVVRAVYLETTPAGFQSENVRIDTGYYWTKLNANPPIVLDSLLDTPENLWLNGYHSSNGKNDRVPVSEINSITNSLYFVKVSELEVFSEISFEKLKVRADFNYNDVNYNLTVTDPEACEEFQTEGNYYLGDCYITVSLGVEFNDNHYKLIAFLKME